MSGLYHFVKATAAADQGLEGRRTVCSLLPLRQQHTHSMCCRTQVVRIFTILGCPDTYAWLLAAGLRSLTWHGMGAQLGLSAMPELLQLTEFSITFVAMRSISQLQQLPPSLQKLQFQVLESYEDSSSAYDSSVFGSRSSV